MGVNIFDEDMFLYDGLFSVQDSSERGSVEKEDRSFRRLIYFGCDRGEIDPWDALDVHGSVGFAPRYESEFVVRGGDVSSESTPALE